MRSTAFLSAALAPVLLFGILSGSLRIIPMAFVIALGHSVLLGIPAFYYLFK